MIRSLIYVLFFSYASLLFSCGEEDERRRRAMYLVPSDDFIITVKTDNPGLSDDNQFTIWATNDGSGTYNYDVDCNDDGVWERQNLNNQYICNYANLGGNGVYTVRIRGLFPRFRAISSYTGGAIPTYVGDHNKILSIEQWGTGAWESLELRAAENVVVNAQDTPNLQNMTRLNGVFSGATSIGSGSGNWNWDTGNIEDMAFLFRGTQFNKDISTWDVSNVTTMQSLFEGTPFNINIATWNTSKVDNFNRMFADTSAFDQNIGNWNVSSARVFIAMFQGAVFNQALSNWDVGKGVWFGGMFADSRFNSPLSNWDMSSATTLNEMFSSTPFNQDISNWNTSNVKYISGMFRNAASFNQNISGWNTSNFEVVSDMFNGATAFNQDLSSWNTSRVLDINRMFDGAVSFDRNLANWNVERIAYVEDFLKGGRLSTANYDALLLSWGSQNVKEDNPGRRLDFHGGNSTYCLGEANRQSLITNKQWTFVDGGKLCSINVELSADVTQDESNSVYVPKLLILGTLEASATLSIIDTGNGSAAPGADYQFASPFLVTIPVGTYDGTLATAIDISGLTILDDDLAERDETIILSLSQPSTNIVFGDTNNDGENRSAFTYTIENRDICTTNNQCPGSNICNLAYNPALCQGIDLCGNSALENGEFCDDGNEESGDGCDENCTIEDGFTCTANADCGSGLCDQSLAPFTCEEVDICGNGTVEIGEVCDDGNIELSDGCDANCKLENGVGCETNIECASGICDGTLQPAKCEPIGLCGNATPEPGEGCDDGNTTSGDGCDENCKIENDTNCVGDRNCKEGLICNADRKCVLACQSDLDCDGKVCDSGRCINCIADGDCGEFETCNLSNNQCEKTCNNDSACAPSGFCKATTSSCVECRDSLDCLTGENCSDGICEGSACNPNNTNCENTCSRNSDCMFPGFSRCENKTKTCVECFAPEHCAGSEICDRDFSCKPACGSDGDCEGEKCNPEGQCVSCLTNVDCEKGECSTETNTCEIACEDADDCEDGFYCSPDRNLCMAGCENDADCMNGTCDIAIHECVETTVDEKPTLITDDEGCGCSSTPTRLPGSLMFLFGILLLSRKRNNA